MEWILASRLRKNYGGAPELHCYWSGRLGQRKDIKQDAQKGLSARPKRTLWGIVEGLNDPRTPLTNVLSILLDSVVTRCKMM